MKLTQLLDGISSVRVEGTLEGRQITGIVAHSNEATVNDIFACIRGHHADGHTYVGDAYRCGARVFLVERAVELPKDATILFCDNARKTSAELLCKLYGWKKENALMVGITGTKGKTSVAVLLGRLLESCGVPTAVIGTLGVLFQGSVDPTPNTTPDLFFLLPRLARLSAAGARVILMECSSQALADERLLGLSFDMGIFTGLSPDHIGTDEHPDFAAYRAAKRRLFSEFCPHHAIVNADDPEAAYMSLDVPRITRCSLTNRDCELFPENVSYHKDGTDFSFFGERVHTALVGEYNLMNTLLALAGAKAITELSYASFFAPLKDAAIPGRFDRILHGGRLFIIDFAHNAESLERLCRTVKMLYRSRILLVFGSVGMRSEGRRAPLARVAERYADLSVITADDPGEEPIMKILSELHGAFCDKTRAVTIADRAEAIRHAYRISEPGDILLLVGKGHERFQRIGKKSIPFSELQIIESL